MTGRKWDRLTPWLAGYSIALGLQGDGPFRVPAAVLGVLLTAWLIIDWLRSGRDVTP